MDILHDSGLSQANSCPSLPCPSILLYPSMVALSAGGMFYHVWPSRRGRCFILRGPFDETGVPSVVAISASIMSLVALSAGVELSSGLMFHRQVEEPLDLPLRGSPRLLSDLRRYISDPAYIRQSLGVLVHPYDCGAPVEAGISMIR